MENVMSISSSPAIDRSDRIKYWYSLFVEWKTSSLSKAKFCSNKKITASAFYEWSRKFQRGEIEPSTESPTLNSFQQPSKAKFAPIIVESNQPQARQNNSSIMMTISLPNGIQIHVSECSDPKQLISYLRCFKEI
jgi:hypothetical protein